MVELKTRSCSPKTPPCHPWSPLPKVGKGLGLAEFWGTEICSQSAWDLAAQTYPLPTGPGLLLPGTRDPDCTRHIPAATTYTLPTADQSSCSGLRWWALLPKCNFPASKLITSLNGSAFRLLCKGNCQLGYNSFITQGKAFLENEWPLKGPAHDLVQVIRPLWLQGSRIRQPQQTLGIPAMACPFFVPLPPAPFSLVFNIN